MSAILKKVVLGVRLVLKWSKSRPRTELKLRQSEMRDNIGGRVEDHDTETGRVEPEDSRGDEDACSKLWEVYVGEAEKYDGELVRGWKQDMESLLIFSSLYSASLTAFIIESYQTLQEDPAETTVNLLVQISQQLAGAANGTTVVFEPPKFFQPAASAVICNLFWFLALALALACSLLATFVQQWTRDFIHKTNMRPSPVLRARILMSSYFGMRRFGMHAIVDIIPFLLHLSLLLFFAGLVMFLSPVNETLQLLMTCVLAVLVAVYLFLTFLPIICLDAPFRTPISSVLFYWRNTTSIWLRRLDDLIAHEDPSQSTSLETSHNRDMQEQAQKALAFTMKSLTDDSELLPLIEAIPDTIYGSAGVRHANIPLIAPLLTSSTPALNVISHITAFGDNPSAWLDEKLKVRCLIAYPQAVWSLAYLFATTPITVEEWNHNRTRRHALDMTKVWFPRRIENKLGTFDSQKHYVTSALALLRLSQLRGLQACVYDIKQKLQESQHRREFFGTPETISLCRQLRARITDVDFSWAYDIYEAFHVEFIPALDLLMVARADPEPRRLEDVIPSCLDLDAGKGKAWVIAQIHILGHFLANSVDSGLEKPRMMTDTYNCLSRRITHQLETIQFSVNDNFMLMSSLCAPIWRFADIAQRNPSFDVLFTYSLRHFNWDKDWACNSQFHDAVECRKIIQDYFVKKSFNPMTVCEADESSYLEACILADFGEDCGDPMKYLPATWLLFYCLTKSPYTPHTSFASQISRAIRNAKNPTLLAQHPLFRLIKTFADAIICSILVYTPWHRIEGLDGVLESVKALGRELLPERREFDDFSLGPTALNSIQNFLTYVSSLQLILTANFITACRDPVEEVQPFRLKAFKKICELPDPSYFVDLNNIDEKSQIRFAEGVSELLSTCRRSRNELNATGPRSHSTLQSGMFEAILDDCNDVWTWITSADAAAIILEALDRHRDECYGCNSEKFQGHADSLHTHCNRVTSVRK